jgi:hypothetical protein
MRPGRDSVRGYVVQGAAMGVGAFLGAALVTMILGAIASRLPFVVKVLPRPADPGGTP